MSTRTTPGAMRAARPLGIAQPVATWCTLHERQDAVLRRAWVCADGHDAHSHRAMPSHADRNGLAWDGLRQVRRIQIYESCAERASQETSYRVEGVRLRKAGAPLTQEDLTLTAQHASARFMLTLLPQLPCA